MAQWNSSDSGILRKNKPKDNYDDLLVFGYQCKLFRDDEKALYIDQGKHLIPWMGDEKLKIDRYDCRGALSDLSRYEASREGFDAMRWLGLSESERKLEQVCDKERYYSLHINEEEEEMYKEEELKRGQANEFQYSYDVPQNPQNNPDLPEIVEPEDEVYVPAPSLDVPVDIPIPKTVKENARIEKTAMFVHKQGVQMEILIKAKQADNSQFSFLNQKDPLYKYYRHVLNAFKSGRYQVQPVKDERTSESSEPDHDGDHYLHPSLLSASSAPATGAQSTVTSIPMVPYKPSANCAYSQLVNRIQGSSQVENQCQGAAAVQSTSGGEAFQPGENMTYEQQQRYYQYYFAAQYYEYYKLMALYQQNPEAVSKEQLVPPQGHYLDPNMQAYIQQSVYSQYMQQQQQQQQENSNPYAQIVSNVNKEYANPYSAMIGMSSGTETSGASSEAVIPIGQLETAPVADKAVVETVAHRADKETVPPVVVGPNLEPQKSKNVRPLLCLTQYGSDSEDENSDSTEDEEIVKETFEIPTDDTRTVIDKMATYVTKNGLEFETTVKSRQDPRFEFLNDNHVYFKYYKSKVRELMGGDKKEKNVVKVEEKEIKKEEKPSKELVVPPKPKERKVIAPVSFSIKKPKEDIPKEIKSALPIEESSDEDEEQDGTTSATNTSTTTTVTSSSSTATSTSLSSATSLVTSAVANTIYRVDAQNTMINEEHPVKEDDSADVSTNGDVIGKNGFLDGDDPILEMIEITDLEDKRDAKRAEDKIKDKLAQAAREKVASKDRALQLERKRKALAFLKFKSAQTPNTADSDSANQSTPPKKSRSSEDREGLEIKKDLKIDIEQIDCKIVERKSAKDGSKRKRLEESEDKGSKRTKDKDGRSPRKGKEKDRDKLKSLKSAEKTPKSAERTSKSVERTQKYVETTQKSVERTQKYVERTPKSVERTLKSLDRTPKTIESTLKTVEKTPKIGERIPKSIERTPKSVERTPKSVERASKSSERAPKLSERTSKEGDKTRSVGSPKNEEKVEVIYEIESDDEEEGEVEELKRRKSHKKKKSHRRKHSKSKHESKSKKKPKKRSRTRSSSSSKSTSPPSC